MVKKQVPLYDNGPLTYTPANPAVHTLGYKKYEITNYLGNVNAVINDRKVYVSSTYEAVMITNSDYYPFGMEIPSRNNNIDKYRFGYNGMEKDDEVKNLSGSSYTTEFRQYDPRLGRWLSLDPLMAQFPSMSPYVAFDDNPVLFNDPSGLATDDWVAKKRIDENGVEHHTWKWVDKSYGSLGEAQADGYIDWMGKGGVVQDMHTSSGYVGPVTLLDGGEHYEGNLPEETAETAMRGKLESTVGETGMTQSQIDAAFNPEKEIVIGTIQEGLAQQISEQNEADLNRLKTRMNLENFNRGLDNLVLGMFGFAYTAPFVIGGGIVYGGAASTFISGNNTLNAMFGFSSEYWAAKASISAVSQAVTNNGKVNVFAAATDGFFGYGSSAILGSGINLEVNVTTLEYKFETLGNGIRTDQYLFQVGTGFVFGAKGELATGGFNKAYGRGRPSNYRQITKMIYNGLVYSPATNLLNRAYDEKTK